MSKYTINVSFQTRVNKTTRTLEIAESFGLGLDEKEWTLYDNLELEVKQGDVVYITGQSGSGKSVVLRELQRQMKDEGLSVASIDDFAFDNEVSRINLTAEDIVETPAPDIVPMKRGAAETKPKLVQRFTREELESIADCEGIAGLRQIGNQIGVKAKGIVEMIEGILKAQGGE
ncbi:hypothetical protein GEO03_12290 [Escherichia coli]|nr:hypothetical protein [Escherichia coli]